MLAEQQLAVAPPLQNLHWPPDRQRHGGGTWWTAGAPLVLILAAFAAYARAIRNGFVWDDNALILRDPLIRSWRLIWEGFQHFLFTDAGASDFYRPLQRLTYTLDYALFIFRPAGYHLDSILWHAAAAVAFYFFAREFLPRFGQQALSGRVAFLAALVWVVHPVHSSAVVYVSGRADPLMASFGFLGLFLALRSVDLRGCSKWICAVAATIALLASALSKEIGLIFPVLWLVILQARGDRRQLLRWLGAMLAVLAVYLSLRLSAEHLAPPPSRHPIPGLVRPIIAARAVAEYGGLVIFPLRLRMERDVETHPFGFARESLAAASWRELETLAGVLLIAGFVWMIWRSRERPAIFLPLIFASIAYIPVSGIVPLNAALAEHWLYVPSAFLLLAAGAFADRLGLFSWSGGSASRVAIVCLAMWITFLAVRAFVRTEDWRDERTFLTRTIADGGNSARMLINLAGLELAENHLAAAQQALEAAIKKEPDDPRALLDLGNLALRRHDFARARSLFDRVTEPLELQAEAQESLAVLENREHGGINMLRLRLAAHLGAPNWQIEKRYIDTLAQIGYLDAALDELKGCLLAAPYRAESWQTLGDLLLRTGRPKDAQVAFREAESKDVHLHEHSG